MTDFESKTSVYLMVYKKGRVTSIIMLNTFFTLNFSLSLLLFLLNFWPKPFANSLNPTNATSPDGYLSHAKMSTINYDVQ